MRLREGSSVRVVPSRHVCVGGGVRKDQSEQARAQERLRNCTCHTSGQEHEGGNQREAQQASLPLAPLVQGIADPPLRGRRVFARRFRRAADEQPDLVEILLARQIDEAGGVFEGVLHGCSSADKHASSLARPR
jgi:hypothetical protein